MCVGGQPVEVQCRVGRVPNIRGRRVTQRADALVADAGEAVEGRQRRRVDAEFAGTPVDKQSTPAVGQAVVEHPVQPAEDRGVVRTDEPARGGMTNRRQFKTRCQERVVVLQVDDAVPVPEPADRLNVTVVPPGARRSGVTRALPSREPAPFARLRGGQQLVQRFELLVGQ